VETQGFIGNVHTPFSLILAPCSKSSFIITVFPLYAARCIGVYYYDELNDRISHGTNLLK